MYVVRRIVRRSTLNRNLDTAYVQYTATLQPRNTRPKNFNNRPTKNKEPQEFQQSEGTTDHSINNRRMTSVGYSFWLETMFAVLLVSVVWLAA